MPAGARHSGAPLEKAESRAKSPRGEPLGEPRASAVTWALEKPTDLSAPGSLRSLYRARCQMAVDVHLEPPVGVAGVAVAPADRSPWVESSRGEAIRFQRPAPARMAPPMSHQPQLFHNVRRAALSHPRNPSKTPSSARQSPPDSRDSEQPRPAAGIRRPHVIVLTHLLQVDEQRAPVCESRVGRCLLPDAPAGSIPTCGVVFRGILPDRLTAQCLLVADIALWDQAFAARSQSRTRPCICPDRLHH